MDKNLINLSPIYFRPGENFEDFLKRKPMIEYTNNFLSNLSLKKLDNSNKPLLLSYKEEILQTIFNREQSFLQHINHTNKIAFPGLKPKNWNEYYKTFNKACQEFFFKNKTDEKNDDYNSFIRRIWDIIGKGGIKDKDFNEVIKKANKNNFVYNLDIFIKEIRKYIKKEINEDGFKKAEITFGEAIASDTENIYENIVKNFFNINKNSFIITEKNIYGSDIKLDDEKHWRTLYEELYNDISKSQSYVFGISETKSFFNAGNVKGSFFEDFIQRKIFKEFTGGGSEKLIFNKKYRGEAPVDAYFNKFGFQLKHGTSFLDKTPPEKLYFEKNTFMKMSEEQNFRFLQEEDWVNFATLLELNSRYNGTFEKNTLINAFLYKLEEFQLRISTNEQFKGEATGLINHVFLVNNKFFPASYVLFKRYNLIRSSKKRYGAFGRLNYEYNNKNFTDCEENNFEKSKNLLTNIILKR